MDRTSIRVRTFEVHGVTGVRIDNNPNFDETVSNHESIEHTGRLLKKVYDQNDRIFMVVDLSEGSLSLSVVPAIKRMLDQLYPRAKQKLVCTVLVNPGAITTAVVDAILFGGYEPVAPIERAESFDSSITEITPHLIEEVKRRRVRHGATI